MLVDDHRVIREGLRMLLSMSPGFEVVGDAGNSADALALVEREQPNIIVLDLDLGGESGLELIPKLLATAEQARILVLTGLRDPEKHREAMMLGVMGVVQKEKAAEILLKAIQKVHAGGIWYDDQSQLGSVLADMRRTSESKKKDYESEKIATLTHREREVITHICKGLSNKDIADKLCISETTVRHHLTSVFEKLEIKGRLTLLIYAFEHNLAVLPAQQKK